MDVGGNVLQAASKTVGKDKTSNPDAVIEVGTVTSTHAEDNSHVLQSLEADMKQTEDEETDTKVLYAPTKFYDDCDECDLLPEERWEAYRLKMEEEKKNIIRGRERVSFHSHTNCPDSRHLIS